MTSASETKTTEGGRGSFILFEGLDRTGKTTQCERLVAQLTKQKVPVVAKKFPDRTTATGAIIDAYLKGKSELDDHALHLLFAANRWEASGEIRSLLEKGTTVVVDRYSYSGAAFSSTKGLDLEWCMAAEKGLPAPDLVLYMSMPSDKLDARKDFGVERYEKKEIQKAAGAVFDDFCESLQGWTSLDATKSIEDLEADILQLVVPALDQNRFSSILVVGQEKLSPMIRVLQNLYNYEFLNSEPNMSDQAWEELAALLDDVYAHRTPKWQVDILRKAINHAQMTDGYEDTADQARQELEKLFSDA